MAVLPGPKLRATFRRKTSGCHCHFRTAVSRPHDGYDGDGAMLVAIGAKGPSKTVGCAGSPQESL